MQSCGVHHPSVCKHFAQIASSRRQMAGSPPNLHMMVPRRARIQHMHKVKVKVKGHVIRTPVISRKSLLAGKWPERYQTCTWWFPARPASRVCSRSRLRSKVTWYGHFCDVTKCLLYSMVSRSVSTCAHFMKQKHHYRILSFQYKYQAARYNVWILEWATPSLTV